VNGGKIKALGRRKIAIRQKTGEGRKREEKRLRSR